MITKGWHWVYLIYVLNNHILDCNAQSVRWHYELELGEGWMER